MEHIPRQPQNLMKTLRQVCVDGFSFDRKEVFILLLRHLGRAGVGVNLKATCQKAARRPC